MPEDEVPLRDAGSDLDAVPGEDEGAVDAELRKELASRLEKKGELPFAEFLEIVLYHPKWGYYSRRGEIFGGKGDFQTAPHVHPLFGWTIARAVLREWERRGKPRRFALVEVGPGAAYLMDDLWSHLQSLGVDTSHWGVTLVERSDNLRKIQEHRLDGRVPATWAKSLEEVDPFSGVLLANEFLDALPFHRLVRRGAGWKEICVIARDPAAKELTWKETGVSDPELVHLLPRSAPQGTVLEESPHAVRWVQELGKRMQQGLALFFDYGDLQENLVEDHPDGTLQTFSRHQAGRDPFVRLGSRDITAWVDFTPFLAAAQGAGFEVGDVRPQSETLYEWGMTQVAEELARSKGEGALEAVRARMAAKTFLFGYATHHVVQLKK